MNIDGKYKQSYYNLVVNESDTTVHIWNVKSGSIVELEKPIYNMLEQENFDGALAEYTDALIKEGVIVHSDLNEQQEIVFCAKQRQYSTSYDSFGLVITPTMNCNFHCPYCFEYRVQRKGHMSEEVQRALVDVLASKLENNDRIKRARITWFGGEPLLAYDSVIVGLQKSIIEICNRLGIQVIFNLITNGYFLTPDKYDFLFKSGKMKFVQITLDGSESDYVKRKGTTSDAYHRVINNVLDLSHYVSQNNLDVKINMRLNADNSNYLNIKELVQQIKSDKRFCDNIKFALERLREYDQCQSLNNYCNTEEFENIRYDFENFTGQTLKFYEPKTVFCGQHCMNAFSIGVNGDVYKCEHDFGVSEHAIGNIKTGLNYSEYFAEFMDQPLPDKCMSCKILPVCMGGCPHRRLEKKGDVECDYTIKNLIRSTKRYILEKEVK